MDDGEGHARLLEVVLRLGLPDQDVAVAELSPEPASSMLNSPAILGMTDKGCYAQRAH